MIIGDNSVTIEGHKYDTPDGFVVPSVTTVLQSLGAPWLADWRTKKSLEYMLDNLPTPDKKWTKKMRDALIKDCLSSTEERTEEEEFIIECTGAAQSITRKAGNLGTFIHKVVGTILLGKDLSDIDIPENEEVPRLLNAINEFLSDLGDVTLVCVEKVVFGYLFYRPRPLRFAGTLDTIIHHLDKNILIDWKTSRFAQDTHAAQASAYAYLYNQNKPEAQKVDELWIVRLAKTGRVVYEILEVDPIPSFELFRGALYAHYARAGEFGEFFRV